MISDIGLDRCQHSHNDRHIYSLEYSKDSMDQINTDNEHKIPHLRYYIGSLSLVSMYQTPSLSVTS